MPRRSGGLAGRRPSSSGTMTCRSGRRSSPRRGAPSGRWRGPSPARRRRAMPFEATIDAFARALSDPAGRPPPQTLGREGRPDARRFAVYRNNVAVALIGAIEARYPVVRRLVGADFFRAMAGAFVAAHRPRSAVMIHYGADFASFIATFEPAREIAYLCDV